MVCGPISHVGIALFNPPGFPTQWVLALSHNELFTGRVVCNTIGLTVNGWQDYWVTCEHSPASFNPTATFMGVIHIAELSRSMESVYAEFSAKGSLSPGENNPAYTDRYVLRALRRIGEKRIGPGILLAKEEELGKAARAAISILLNHQYAPVSRCFPVAFLQMGGIEVLHAKIARF